MKYLIYICLLAFFVSCQEDPFDNLTFEINPYDSALNTTNAVVINDISVVKYDIRTSTNDTLFVKYNINANLSPVFFENNYIFDPIVQLTPEVYVNDVEHKINIEPGTKQMYIYASYHYFRGRENELVFKFNLVKDNERRKIASNNYRFRLN